MMIMERNFLNEPGHGWSPDRKRGWGVHKWPERVKMLLSTP